MATIPNPYNYVSPIGQALGNLTKTMLSGPSQAERIAAAETALKLKNTRESTGRVADMFATYNQPGFDRNALARDAVIAGYDPANMERYLAYNTPGTNVEARDRSFGGAGGAYSGTETAFGIDQGNQNMRAANVLAETVRNNDIQSVDRRYNVDQSIGQSRYEFDNKPQPSLVNGVPAFVPQSGVFDPTVAPIMSETDQKGTQFGNAWGNLGDLPVPEQRALGVDAGAGTDRKPWTMVGTDGKSYVTQNGTVDLYGNPIPGGPGSYIAGVQGSASDALGDSEKAKQREAWFKRSVSIQKTTRMVEELDKMLQQPNAAGALGVIGSAAGIINGLASQAQAAAELAGIPLPEGVRSVETYIPTLQKLGIKNAEMQSVIVDLAYAIADDREGGQKSTQDVYNAIRTIGGKLGDPVAMRAVLKNFIARKTVDFQSYDKEARRVYGDGLGLPAEAIPGAAAAAGQPPAPAAGARSVPIMVIDEESYNSLPAGSQYLDPQGNLRTKAR